MSPAYKVLIFKALKMSQTEHKDGLDPKLGHCSNVVFYGFDTIVGLLIFIDSIILLANIRSFEGFFLPLYFLVFGLLIILFVIYAPPQLYASLIFYFNFIGRGLTFLFLGSVILTFGDDFSLATGIITIIISFIYLIFSIWTKFCNLQCSLPIPVAQRQDGIKTTNNKNTNAEYKQPPQQQQQPQTSQPPQQQEYGNDYDETKLNEFSPQLMNDNNNNDLNKEIMNSFGKDINSIPQQSVPGYSGKIPVILVMLEQGLNDTNGYNKYKIFDPDTISIKKDNDKSYLISNNIISFFNELPSALLSFIDIKVFELGIDKDSMWRVLQKLPNEQAAITQFIWDMLAKVSKFESNTNMNSQQLAKIFGPLMTMNKQQISNDALTSSKMIACWKRGIESRMDKL